MRIPKEGTEYYRSGLKKIRNHEYYDIKDQDEAGIVLGVCLLLAGLIVFLAMII